MRTSRPDRPDHGPWSRDPRAARARPSILALALSGLLIAAGCTRLPVETRLQPGADLSRLETYAPLPAEERGSARPDPDSPLDRRVWRHIAEALEDRGYRAAPLASADLVVAFRVRADERVRTRTRGGPDSNYDIEQPILDTTVEIDLVDARRGELAWHGLAEREVADPEALAEAALASVDAILAKLPPRRPGAAPPASGGPPASGASTPSTAAKSEPP